MHPSETLPESETICVSQIQHFSVNDGEGIRSTVFLAGCPLRCRWCCNPETWTPEPKTGCLPGGRLEIFGQQLSVKQVVRELERYVIFYRESDGGVTWSGGEPFFFPRNLRSLVRACSDKGISQTVETSCLFVWEDVADIVHMLDFVFADIKHMDDARHKELTGMGNGLVLSNLKRLGKSDVETVVRVPLMRGVNDDEENIARTARFVRANVPQGRVELLPYHDFGRMKYRMLCMEDRWTEFKAPSRERVEFLEERIRSEGAEPVRYR